MVTKGPLCPRCLRSCHAVICRRGLQLALPSAFWKNILVSKMVLAEPRSHEPHGLPSVLAGSASLVSCQSPQLILRSQQNSDSYQSTLPGSLASLKTKGWDLGGLAASHPLGSLYSPFLLCTRDSRTMPLREKGVESPIEGLAVTVFLGPSET